MSRPRRAVLLVLAALAVVPALVAPGADAAPAAPAAQGTQDAPGPVTVRLTGLTPVVPAPGGTLVVSGVLTNTTAGPVDDVEVRLRVSPTPVRSRDEIADILAGSAGRTGVAVESTRADVTRSLAAGASKPFTVSVPLDDLPLPDDDSVVVLGVESLGDLPGTSGGSLQTGYTRTFLPWFPQPDQVSPTRVVWLYPLSTAPSRLGDDVFLDDHLAAEVGSGGRLTALLDAASVAPTAVAWVVDPALLESLVDMSDGYRVQAAGGATSEGTGAGAAQAWLARVRALTATAEMTASSYADPDVVALHRAGLDVDIALAATTASGVPDVVLGRPVEGGLAWPADGLADDGTLDVLRATGARVVVLSAASLPPRPAVPYTPSASVDLASGGSPLRALAADPTLSRLVQTPVPAAGVPDEPVARRQRVLAELAMTTLELPSVSRTVVVAPGVRWRTDAATTADLVGALTTAPWAAAERLDTLVAAPPSTIPRERSDYPAAARRAELAQTYLARVASARQRLAGLRSVAPDSLDSGTEGLESALTRTESAAWRREGRTGQRLLTEVAAEIDAQIDAVQVLSRAPITLPGDSGVIPVTVANDLDRPARVGVRLTGTPTVRFEADDVPPVTIAPGQKQTLEVTARVLGTGPVTVDITLLTPEGQVFGAPVSTEVRSAAYSRAAAWVVAGLFGILVVLLGINFVRRRRPAAAVPADPDDATAAEGTDDATGGPR